MMNEKQFADCLDRRLSGLCASEVRRQRIREAVEAERMSEKQPAHATTVRFPTRRLVLVAALLLMLLLACAAAAICDWNVLAFLGIQSDGSASDILTPVGGQSSHDKWSIAIHSAVTDGEYLAFDWTLEKQDLETPEYIQVESLTANGQPLSTDGTDDFHCQWVPGIYFSGNDRGGNLCCLPEGLTEDQLLVEMVIGVYRPTRPVYQMDMFDAALACQKLDEGYYVIAEGEGFVLDLPEEGLSHCFGMVNETTMEGLERSEICLRFPVDAKAGRATRRMLPLPEPVRYPGFTMAYTDATASVLQTRLCIALTPDENTREAACALLEKGYFSVTDAKGEWLATNVLDGLGGVEQAQDGRWCAVYECSLAQDAELPEEISLSYRTHDEQVFVAPLRIDEGS